MTISIINCPASDVRVIASAATAEGLECRNTLTVELAVQPFTRMIFAGWEAGQSGLHALDAIRQAQPVKIPVVVVSCSGGALIRRRSFEAGAADVLSSPLTKADVRAEIQALLGREREADVERRLEFDVLASHLLLGNSPRFKACVEQLRKATLVEGNVLILGETGTGKEVFANALHRLGDRSAHRFLAVNCGALHGELLESELFGHALGAFTGALRDHAGRFEEVGAGTLFLDEIGELPLNLQVKLLRAIEAREFQRIGENRNRTFSGRLVTATLVDLNEAVQRGIFRQDLKQRLDQFRIVLPALGDRRDDIPILANHFLQKHARGRPLEISNSAMEILRNAEYPGNIRQLDNTIHKAVASALPKMVILPQHLPEDIRDGVPHGSAGEGRWRIDDTLPYAEARERAPVEVDRVFLGRWMTQFGGNKSAAAKAASIDRKTFAERWKEATGDTT